VDLWTIGVADRLRFTRFPSRKMLTFAHIPTGTTVNKATHIDASKSRGIASAAAQMI
jgi:hypothetical protein